MAALLAVCTTANAQEKVTSINVGFAPYGYIHEGIKLKDEKYKYDYKSYWSAVVGFEKQLKGVVSLTEVTYAQAKFDKHDITGNSEWFNPYQKEDIQDFTLTQYFGKTINPGKRVQFPIYIGIGGEYVLGGPMHNLALDGAIKARVKFFISDKIGIYAGGNARYGWGMKKANSDSSSISNDKDYTLSSVVWHIDAGVVFSL